MAKVAWNTPETELVMKYLVGSPDYDSFEQIARSHYNEQVRIGKMLTPPATMDMARAKETFGGWLADYIHETREHTTDIFDDLVTMALCRVDWSQVAESFIQKAIKGD